MRGGARDQVVGCSWGRIGGVRARWWWWKNERERTKINRDAVDGGFKLRLPPIDNV